MSDPVAVLLDLLNLSDEVRVNLAFEQIENLNEPPVLHFALEFLGKPRRVLMRISRREQLVRRLQVLNDESLEGRKQR